MARVIIPTPLRKFTNNQSTFESKGAQTVEDAVINLIETYPSLGKHLLDDDQKIRSFIRIYVGDEDINALDKEKTGIGDDSIVSIIPAIAGGSELRTDNGQSVV